MKRATFITGMATAVAVMLVAAIAILVFTPATFETLFEDRRFVTTLAAAGVGGFLGTLFRKKNKTKGP